MTTWKTLSPAALALSGKVSGVEGTVFYVTLDEDGTPAALVQPGRGVEEKSDPIHGTRTVPVEHPNDFHRAFGREPGPEWVAFGKPYAVSVRVEPLPRHWGQEGYRATPGTFDKMTPAARTAVYEWLTHPDVVAEIFTPRNVAEAVHSSAESDAYYAEAAYSEALKKRNDAVRTLRAARKALDKLDAVSL